MKAFTLAAAAAVALLVQGCGGGAGGDSSANDTAGTTTVIPSYGVAGLIPPHFPNASNADWQVLYQGFRSTGGLVGVYTNWSDSPARDGKVPAAITSTAAAGKASGFAVFPAVGVARETAGGRVESTVAWGNPAQVESLRAMVAALATQLHPAMLAIGVEINRLSESDPTAFEAFVAAWPSLYAAAKSGSPTTLIFPVFQYEMTRGGAHLMGGREGKGPQWDLVARFGDSLDAVAFTTYPFFDFETPAMLPADYYTEIGKHSPKPVVFTEAGWPSAPLSAAPSSGYGGSDAEQREFVDRFFALTTPLNLRAALWAFPHDIHIAGAFESVALRANDGSAKPALAAWEVGIRR